MDKPPIAELQDFGEREQCNYIFQKGINMNQQCCREIPLGNCFCRTQAKTAFAKKLLSSNEVEEEEEVEVEERKKRVSFNKLPSKKKEQEEDVDPDNQSHPTTSGGGRRRPQRDSGQYPRR